MTYASVLLSFHRLRLIPALAALAALSAPRIPESVDDVYILADYARRLVETGRLEWTTGERVEGYSSLASVLLAALLQLLGMAPESALKLLAALATIATAALADRVLPRTAAGSAALLGLVLATPTVRWAVDGMDGPLFALLLSAGWLLLLRARSLSGLLALAIASTVRPEGVVHVLAALPLVGFSERPVQALRSIAPAVAALAAYHVVRVVWFGHLVATPTLLKILATQSSLYGLRQALVDLAPYLGVFALLMPGSGRGRFVGLVPLAIQIVVETRASGDWMGGGRLIMPGAVATGILLGDLAQSEGAKAAAFLGWRRAFGAAACILGAMFLPAGWGHFAWEFRPLPSGSDLIAGVNRGLVTPLPEDVAWIVEHVPDGRCVLVNDVGMMGGIPNVCVLDMRGLVTRASAEAAASGQQDAWFTQLLASDHRPFAVREAWWGDDPRISAAWLTGRYPTRTMLRYPGGEVGWSAERTESLDPGVISRRWAKLAAQHPDHPWITWRAAIAAVNAGDLAGAHALARAASGRWPEVDMVADATDRWSVVSGEAPLDWEAGRGFRVDRAATFTTQPVGCRARLAVESAAPVVLRVSAGAGNLSHVAAEVPDARTEPMALRGAECAGEEHERVEISLRPQGSGEDAYFRISEEAAQ